MSRNVARWNLTLTPVEAPASQPEPRPQINFRTTEANRRALKVLAAERGTTIEALMEAAVAELLAGRRKFR